MSDALIEAFEATLRENPDDLATWSAYADYLSEQGDPRGECMAVQLALEDESRPAEERARLKRREEELLADRERWLGLTLAAAEVEAKEHFHGLNFGFRRGWVQTLEIEIEGNWKLLPAIASAPELRWTSTLTIDGPDRSDFDALGQATFLSMLRRFHVGGDEENSYADRLDDAVETIIANAPRLESVTLNLKEAPSEALFNANLPHLREATVGSAWYFATEALTSNPALRNLQTLRLVPYSALAEGRERPEARLTLENLGHIANSPHLVSLSHLRFSLSDAGDEGIELLISSGLLFRLEVLDLKYGSVTDTGASALAKALRESPHRLRTLNLAYNALTEAGIAALTRPGLSLFTEAQHETGRFDYLAENGCME